MSTRSSSKVMVIIRVVLTERLDRHGVREYISTVDVFTAGLHYSCYNCSEFSRLTTTAGPVGQIRRDGTMLFIAVGALKFGFGTLLFGILSESLATTLGYK